MSHANRDAAANPRRAQVEMLAGHADRHLLPLAGRDAGRSDPASQAGSVRPLAGRDWAIKRADVLNLLVLMLEGAVFLALVKGMPL